MPVYKFLNNNEVLNKNNLKQKLNDLFNKSNNKVSKNPSKVKKEFEDYETLIYKERINEFFNLSKKYFDNKKAVAFALHHGQTSKDIRDNRIDYLKKILSTCYIRNDAETKEAMRFLNNKQEASKLTYEKLVERTIPLIKEEYKHLLGDNIAISFKNSFLKNNFDDYLDFIIDNFTEEEIQNIGNDLNNFKAKYEYDPLDKTKDEITDFYTQETLNILNTEKKLGARPLTEEEIKNYEKNLNYVNDLLGDPNKKIDNLIRWKENIDRCIEDDYSKNIDARLEELGYDLNPITEVQGNVELGTYPKITDGKEREFNNTRNNIELNLSNESKKNIKEILHKMKEYGFDQVEATEQAKDNVYGLKILKDSIKKYDFNLKGIKFDRKDELSNQKLDKETNKKYRSALLAKELEATDKKVEEILGMIKKNMPVNDPNNLAFAKNMDVIKNENIPYKYRVDYPAVSVLGTLSLISNMITDNNWDIDEFVEKPMEHIRKLYDEKYIENLDPTKNQDKEYGSLTIYNLARNYLRPEDELFNKNSSKILEGLALMDNDEVIRLENYAKYKSFENTVKRPYEYMKDNKCNIVKKNNLDKLIIKPDLPVEDLGIRKYDPKTLKFTEPEEDNFDDVSYLKLRTESLHHFKERIDREILNYLNEEVKLVDLNKKRDASRLSPDKYLNIIQKAVAKYLIVNNDKRNDPDYTELVRFLRFKRDYVTDLIDSIPQNEDLQEFMLVRQAKRNQIRLEDGTNYNIDDFTTHNPYHSVITSFDHYRQDRYTNDERSLVNFINNDKAQVLEIKNIYNSYVLAKQTYDNEVRKIYGEGYNGIVNNFSNEKIKNAFIKQNDLLRKCNDLKKENIKSVEDLYKQGKLTLTYLKDRQISFENNNYIDIPLYRTQHQFTLDEFIAFKYPNQEFDQETKELLFNNYKADVEKEEIDRFCKGYIYENNLTDARTVLEELPVVTLESTDLDESIEDIVLSGLNPDEIAEIENFDSIKYILDDERTLGGFKEDLDKKLTDYIIEYVDASKDKKLLRQKPALKDIISVAQRVALKYVLLKGDDSSHEYKELTNFIIDGNNYIDKLIEKENKNIAERNHELVNLKHEEMQKREVGNDEFVPTPLIKFNAKQFNINDSDINKDASRIAEFEKYLQNRIKNNKLPNNVKEAEEAINARLKPLFDRYKDLKLKKENQEYRENGKDNPLYSDEENALNRIGALFDRKELVDYDDQIIELEEEINNQLSIAKEKINNLYRSGSVSEDYVRERYNRLNEHNLKLPTMYEIDAKLSMNDYLKKNNPNYRNLSKAEKTSIYNQYIRRCTVHRRNQIAVNFLEEKEIAPGFERNSATYNQYISDLEVELGVSQEALVDDNDIKDLLNGEEKEEFVIDNKDNEFINKVHKSIDEEDIDYENIDEDIIDENIIIANKDNFDKIK